MRGVPGRRSSTVSRPARSDRSWSLLPMPNVLYVGSGEGLGRPDLSVGDGIYKSTDAGKHLDPSGFARRAADSKYRGRSRKRRIGCSWLSPDIRTDPTRNAAIFRSTDGGQSFRRCCSRTSTRAAMTSTSIPSIPNIVYATLWEERQGPWENAQWRGTGGGIYKSTDGGSTWKQLTSGLPQNGAVTQANLAIAPSNSKRVYAAVAVNAATSFYRSDDAGETWTQITQDSRPVGRIGGGDLAVPIVNPKNADMLISASTVAYKSTDGGKSWVPFNAGAGKLAADVLVVSCASSTIQKTARNRHQQMRTLLARRGIAWRPL